MLTLVNTITCSKSPGIVFVTFSKVTLYSMYPEGLLCYVMSSWTLSRISLAFHLFLMFLWFQLDLINSLTGQTWRLLVKIGHFLLSG